MRDEQEFIKLLSEYTDRFNPSLEFLKELENILDTKIATGYKKHNILLK